VAALAATTCVREKHGYEGFPHIPPCPASSHAIIRLRYFSTGWKESTIPITSNLSSFNCVLLQATENKTETNQRIHAN